VSSFETLRPLLDAFWHRRRRVATYGERAHIELKALDSARLARFESRLRATLTALGGVAWMEVNATTGRVVVAFDPAARSVDELLVAVELVEALCGAGDAGFPDDRPEHPGDIEPLLRALIAVGADVVGVGAAIVGRLVRVPVLPLEIDFLAALALLDATPRLREAVVGTIGSRLTEIVINVSRAFAQGLMANPLGPVVDLAYRAALAGDTDARRRAWARREPELCASPARARDPGIPAETVRPVPLPDGPIERYVEMAVVGSLGAFGVGLAATHSVAAGAAPLFGGLPRPAQVGREAFAALLGRTLAARGVIVRDRRVLRLLERIDCLVLDWHAPEWEDAAPEARTPAGARGPDDGGTPADRLIEHARAAGLQVRVAGRRRRRGNDAAGVGSPPEDGIALVPGTGPPLERAIRDLQRQGRVVCFIGNRASPGFAAADCGVALVPPDGPVPWAAHVLARDQPGDAALVIDACRAAREMASQSVALAEAGAAAGLLFSFAGLRRQTTGRVLTAVNLATIVAMANAARLTWGLDAGIGEDVALPPAPWHAMTRDEALAALGSSGAGLSDEEAARRQVPAPPGVSRVRRLAGTLVRELDTPFFPLLAAGTGLSAMVGSVVDATLVAGAMVLNAGISSVQRLRTEEAVAALRDTAVPRARVRRADRERVVDACALVRGDVVLLRAHDVVPADCRILEAIGLEIDESSLTGESVPVMKDAGRSAAAAVAERTSMLYEGTSVLAGYGTGVVVATGGETEARRAMSLKGHAPPKSGVAVRLQALTELTAPLALVSGLVASTVSLARGRSIGEVVSTGVSLAVAAVPEGLPLVATVAELAAARRLSGRGVLVRNPGAVEALGRVDVVCVDKTGTLTEGRIQLAAVSDGSAREAVAALGPAMRGVLAAGLRATPDGSGDDELPRATDRALARGAAAASVGTAYGAAGWRRLSELPFEPQRAFHAVLGQTAGGWLVSVKGAPEVVLPRCTSWILADEERTLDDVERARLADEGSRLAREGYRVLAVAERPATANGSLPDERVARLAFRGFLAFSDPVRPTAVEGVDGLRRAGIEIVMLTGDHRSTAESVASELGILARDSVVTGGQLDGMDDDELAARLPAMSVFARVTPAHKVRIVGALQRAGRIVAVTGDGANDAPAIRLANVGIALGRRGTPAARDAADLLVTDDRIETIIDAVLEGRAMWRSVREAVSLLVGGNVGEIGFILFGSLVGGDTPLNARQLLLVNLLTDIAPAMTIATRPPGDVDPAELLREGPEASLAAPLQRDIVWRALVTGGGASAAWLAARVTGRAARARTVGLVALVGTQLGQTLVAGGRSPLTLAAALGSLGALAAIVQTPGLSHAFGCRPLGPLGWLQAGTATAVAIGTGILLPRLAPSADAWVERMGVTSVEGAADVVRRVGKVGWSWPRELLRPAV
jgi:cation-transporting ATPase I